VAALQEAGAYPVVISPVLCSTLERQAERGEIDAIRRPYQVGDLAGARLVIAATDDSETNEAVWNEAQAVGCLVNVVDDPQRCNFYVPATVRRGALTLSVSTGGKSPLLARRIREALELQYGDVYESYLELLGELRPWLQEHAHEPSRRKEAWGALLDSDVLDLLKAGEARAARQRAQAIVQAYC
jgi:precorrin-2 dehydrogenase/sirohydrochlorin ferrochelatase